MKRFQEVKADMNIPKLEEEILFYWRDHKIFEKSLTMHGGRTFSFYDGPPFATGLPHYGHLLAGILKDIVPRYWTMRGYNVSRRFGWDCHGLPVEYEINKLHKINTRKQILEMGIATYNAYCKSIVSRYSQEWEAIVGRTGRWVDMQRAYYTMQPEFMQSVWWVFKQLWDKGLIYEDYKVVPYSIGISTPLSNFEAGQNYKDVQDPAITVAFKSLEEPNTFFLAWTTTPWTLVSNLAVAVHRDIDYVCLKSRRDGSRYYLADALTTSVFKDVQENFAVDASFKGMQLLGKRYEPLFPYFADRAQEGAFRIIHAEHVTTDSGTGIVHMAPAFGEEDFFACKDAGLPLVNPVDDDGRFTSEVPEYAGMIVKDADGAIIRRLKERNQLIKHETITHSYPFCWRSDTPLIYRAVSSWFVAVEKIKTEILASNKSTRWVPEPLRDGRFGNWLENARDWAISRNRFWGTPIPIWKNRDGEVMCIGSMQELERLTGQEVTDLHMEFVQGYEIPSPSGKSPLKHVGTVLDCWFESGSMPYAQWGYPFQNKAEFEAGFPADFIAEGLDQTRGWFYTLMVIGTALFGKAPFKNVVVNGLILAEDGKKMSKSLRNYPDPSDVLNRHGADALRLYLIDSPVVKGQELRFSEKGVHDVVRKILLRWWNAYSFLVSYATIDGFEPSGHYASTPNILDQWVLSRLNTLTENTRREMNEYRLYNVVPSLLQFIEELTNTYIRFNREVFWQEGMPEEKRFAYETLFHVLVSFSKIMAPFAPFMSEAMYLNLSRALPSSRESVHLELFPEPEPHLHKPDLEDSVHRMEVLVALGRNLRERIDVKAKIPLKSMRLIHRDRQILDAMKPLQPYFQEELNIEEVYYDTNEDKFVEVSCCVNFRMLGKRLGAKMKAVAEGVRNLSLESILRLESGESLTIGGESISLADVEIRRTTRGDNPCLLTHQLVSVEIDPTVTTAQIEEGLAREIVRKIQAARKHAGLRLDDRIRLELKVSGRLKVAAHNHEPMIRQNTLARELEFTNDPAGEHVETAETGEGSIVIGLRALAK
jgi:isoleucyl-tRNA synthetase